MSLHEVSLLIVDDDASAIQVMSRMLAQYPDQRFATSGEAALRLARESTPDLILMDVDMPGMSGLDVFEAMKADPVLARVPVIFATSHDATALEVTALRQGAADFVTKPFIAVQLAARVRAHLRAKSMVEELKRDSLASSAAIRLPGTRTPCILIVDDDAASIHILRHTLAAMGDLAFAKSGEEALQLARRIVPDLILLDAHMPGIDGFDVCRSLKAEPMFRHVPIAFVTRFSDPRYEMRALDLGAADFIAKPYTGAVLQARVRNLLDLKRRTDAELHAMREHWRRVGDARVADIVGAASDAIVTCDDSAKIVLVNASACRMFGIEHDQAIGSPLHSLLGEDALVARQGQARPSRTFISRANGDRFPVDMSVSWVGEGPERLTTVMLRDTSDQERLEAESRARIEAETASRTKTLMMSYIAQRDGQSAQRHAGIRAIDGGRRVRSVVAGTGEATGEHPDQRPATAEPDARCDGSGVSGDRQADRRSAAGRGTSLRRRGDGRRVGTGRASRGHAVVRVCVLVRVCDALSVDPRRRRPPAAVPGEPPD